VFYLRQRDWRFAVQGILLLVVTFSTWFGVWSWPGKTAWAAATDLVPLTLEQLQDRVKKPIQSDGLPVIDLRHFVIDLRSENSAFREQFYQLLQSQLQRPGTPIGLDLSYSQIQGDFQISQLGLRAPLYGDALSPIFTPAEQDQLKRDRRRLSRLITLSRLFLTNPNQEAITPIQISVYRGSLKLVQTRFFGVADFTNTFFLRSVEVQAAQFMQLADWSQTRFSQAVNFIGVIFKKEVRFRNSIFFAKGEFRQARFQGEATFQNVDFQANAEFNQAVFEQIANFQRVQWQGNADFAQVSWFDQAFFSKGSFNQGLFFTDAVFDKSAMFREARFNRPVNLRGASINEKADFGYAVFTKEAYLNVAGMRFDSDRAKLVGNPGEIGRVISVPTLQGNENLLRELVRNFRKQEQIPDANYIDYRRQQLHLQELRQQLFGVNINAASPQQLQVLGFTAVQANNIVKQRAERPFRTSAELLSLANVDIATYINVRDRLVAGEALFPPFSWLNRLSLAFRCLVLSQLLALSHYGTSFPVIFGVGLITIAYFAVIFWLCDRWRRIIPNPILPSFSETIAVAVSFVVLASSGLLAVFRNSEQPWATLISVTAISVPIPFVLLFILYKEGRYHPKMDSSYFMEEGTLRQFRILLGRLPIIPRYEMFRERYLPIILNRRWSWLNYFDFSLNNLLKFGFNDIRLRDEYVPGIITTLVWYQWGVGLLFIGQLLWTLSRTIPGLNLLIYFK